MKAAYRGGVRLTFALILATAACRSEAPSEAPASPTAASPSAASPSAAPPTSAATPSPSRARPGPAAPEELTTHEVGSSGPAVILLHGYGAQGDDLVPFARQLGAAHFYMPEAPIAMPTGGRRWFGRQSEGASADELAAAREGVLALIKKLEAEGTPPNEIILGGFSQGAMLSVEVAQHLAAERRQLGGLVVLSGSTMPNWPAELAVRTSVLITHGQSDPVLAFAQAEQLRDRLSAGGSDVEFVPFPGGHAIPPIVRSAVADFIRRRE